MTDEQVKRIMQSELEPAGVWQYVDTDESLFLRSDGIFAHVVLNDATFYEQTFETMRSLLRRLKDEGETPKFLLRCHWQLMSVEYRGPCYSNGAPTAALCYLAMLKSGNRSHSVEIGVSYLADHKLKEQGRNAVDAVRRYILQLLSATGEHSAWEPLTGTERELIDVSTVDWIDFGD